MEHSRLRHTVITVGAAAAAMALLAGCTTNKAAGPAATEPTTQQRALARYEAYAGSPVDSFTWLGRFDSWQALGENRLLVYTTPRDAYLLKIAPPCDLRFVVDRVGLTSTNATVYKGLDSVVVSNAAAGGPWQCAILEILPVDISRMKADLRNPQPRPAQPAPQ